LEKIEVTTNYKGWWYIVLFPTLQFLVVLVIIPFFVAIIQGDNVNDLLMVLSIFITIPISLFLTVKTYPFFLKLAERKISRIIIENNTLSWQFRKHIKSIILSEMHNAIISFGVSPVYNMQALGLSIMNKKDSINICTFNFHNSKLRELFPAEFFISSTVITPEEGLPAFQLNYAEPTHKAFIDKLLISLWDNRNKNPYFVFTNKFPWERTPSPAFTSIREFYKNKLSSDDKKFIDSITSQVIAEVNSYLKITPDYLIGLKLPTKFQMLFSKDLDPEIYYIMPLKYIKADVLLPKTDLSTYLFVQSIDTAINKSHTGSHLIHVNYTIKITGKRDNGTKVELVFEWVSPTDENYWESKYILKYINENYEMYS